MAVTVIQRPQGHILDTTQRDALVTDDYSNQGALFDDPDHGLVDGDYVFITSDIDNYNGFWYVEQINSRYFWLREYATGPLLQWVVDAPVNYYKVSTTHGWSSVHLPIVYKLSNNRWPTNSIDTARTISSVTDDNGYCALSLSGDIKASGNADELDYVKVSTGALAGIYQIISYTSDTSFTINALYSAANDTALTSATIQYYYNNYNVRVRLFAGLSASHFWTAQKPYEQIVDLKLVPDSSGIVEVNINEYLKKQIKVLSNNLLLATLPNDIDSFCQFYISTSETFDETDGETQTTSTPSFTADSSNFEGVAVNSDLPFKNRYSGYLSEYLMTSSTSKFLTLFDQPRLFTGCYFDIGFLLLTSSGVYVKLESYKNGAIVSTNTIVIDNYDLGVYRKEISAPSNPTEDRIDITLVALLPSLNLWVNAGSGAFTDWTLGSTPTATLPNLNDFTNLLYTLTPFEFVKGVTYAISINADFGANDTTEISISTLQDLVTIDNGTFSASNTGTTTVTINVTPTDNINALGIRARNGSASSNTVTINSIEFVDDYSISETKTINIDTDCSNWDIYLTWKNYLGGMDYWKFTSGKAYIADVESTSETTENIIPSWPKSYGEFADTIDKFTSKIGRDKITVRSQNMTEEEMNGVRYILTSPLVQIMVSKSDRRTVKVTPGSFTWKEDETKQYSVEFEISYTNQIPSQKL